MDSFYSSTKGRLLFGLRGRIPRTDFWVGLIATVGITTLAILLGGNSVRVGGLGPFFAVVTAISVLSPFCLAAVVVKRLHDLDMAGWYVLAFFVPLLLAALAAMAHLGLREGRVIEEWQGFWTMTFYMAAGLATLFPRVFRSQARTHAWNIRTQSVWTRSFGCSGGANVATQYGA